MMYAYTHDICSKDMTYFACNSGIAENDHPSVTNVRESPVRSARSSAPLAKTTAQLSARPGVHPPRASVELEWISQRVSRLYRSELRRDRPGVSAQPSWQLSGRGADALPLNFGIFVCPFLSACRRTRSCPRPRLDAYLSRDFNRLSRPA